MIDNKFYSFMLYNNYINKIYNNFLYIKIYLNIFF